MTLDEIKRLVAEAKHAITIYNNLANQLAEAGVTIELDTYSQPHGVVGIGKVEAREIRASFMLELE